jgi:GNAT superfamily N-acetyltransferase
MEAPRDRPGVRRIRADEGLALRAVRLAALSADPLAFGSTLERELPLPEAHWRQRSEEAASGTGSTIYLAADLDRAPYGMLGAFTPEDGSRHLWGMWVDPSRRGRGVGAALLNAVLAWCQEVHPPGPVWLDVNPDQRRAVRLYERQGFGWTGTERPLGHDAPAVTRVMRRPAIAPESNLATRPGRGPDA